MSHLRTKKNTLQPIQAVKSFILESFFRSTLNFKKLTSNFM